MDEIIVNAENYDHHLYLAEQYLNKELPVDKVEWYDQLIAAIELYEDSIWPIDDDEIDDEGGTI